MYSLYWDTGLIGNLGWIYWEAVAIETIRIQTPRVPASRRKVSIILLLQIGS